MAELHDRLRQIADLQGREYIDGTRIQGPAGPPPPNLPPGFGDDWPDDLREALPDEEEAPETPEPSPLVQIAQRPAVPPAAPPAVQFECTVLAMVGGGCIGSVDGREVELSDTDRARVRRIVLEALAREIATKLGPLIPRRKRSEAQRVPATGAPEPSAARPRRRVRRKNLIRDGAV